MLMSNKEAMINKTIRFGYLNLADGYFHAFNIYQGKGTGFSANATKFGLGGDIA